MRDGILYLAELYLPTTADAGETIRRAREAAEGLLRAGEPIRLVHAIAIPVDEMCFLLFEAGSAEAITRLGTRAGLTFDRVVEAASD